MTGARSKRATPLGEFRAIDVLAKALGAPGPNSSVEVGIGDDAAVLRVAGERLVWSVDSSLEGRHFDLRWLSVGAAAARATSAALSDLAAMGARPLAALCALEVPPRVTRAQLRAIGNGQSKACARAGCALVGGNVARAKDFGFTTTVLGTSKRPLLRSGAQVGDEVWLVGEVGMAALGLKVLQAGGTQSNAQRTCVRAWREPRALIDEGLAMAGRARCAIDVSDGLASEARHLATSSGVQICVEAEQLLATCPPTLRKAARELGCDALDLMLYGGEDYALLATGPARRRPPFALVIGSVRAGKGAWLAGHGRLTRLAGGYDHLA